MSDQTRDILHVFARRLDDTRDLLDTAAEQSAALEGSLQNLEYAVNDLQWDTAKVLLDLEPNRPTLHLVRTGAEQLNEQLRDPAILADQIHDTLSEAGRNLQHTDRLISALGDFHTHSNSNLNTDPTHVAEVADLTRRAEQLSTLVQVATPLADRAHQQLGFAREALEQGISSSTEPGRDGLQKFRSLARGVVDATREITRARTSSRDGAEVTDHAVRSSTVTAASARDLLRTHQQNHQGLPSVRDPSGPTI